MRRAGGAFREAQEHEDPMTALPGRPPKDRAFDRHEGAAWTPREGNRDAGAPARAAPAVSIVIQNHNYARFLGRCIESALGQTCRAVEIIVVDDGSTDGSRDVIAGFGSRIVPIFQDNRG